MNKNKGLIVLYVFIGVCLPLTWIIEDIHGDPIGPIASFMWMMSLLLFNSLMGKGPLKSDKDMFTLLAAFLILIIDMMQWGLNLYHLKSLTLMSNLLYIFILFIMLFVDDDSGPPRKGRKRKARKDRQWKLRLIPQLT